MENKNEFTKEKIIIQQEIMIGYNSEESRQLCINKVLNNTNWIAFTEGTMEGSVNKYSAVKTDNISLVK